MNYICLIMCTSKIFSTFYFEEKKKTQHAVHTLIGSGKVMSVLNLLSLYTFISVNKLHPGCVWDTAGSAYRCVSNTKKIKIRVWYYRSTIQNPICREGQFGNTSKVSNDWLQPKGAVPPPFPVWTVKHQADIYLTPWKGSLWSQLAGKSEPAHCRIR